jgi:malic enzyme
MAGGKGDLMASREPSRLATSEGPHRLAPGGRHDAPESTLRVREHGRALISNALLNKGTAFTDDERDAFGLRGLLPPRVTSIEEQVALELEHIRRKDDDLERYIGLSALQGRNETLFYRVLVENLEEFLPIVYTPTVGRACQVFSHIFRRPRGAWITPADIDRIDTILASAGAPGTRLIVVTDNERILGLGDQGAGGMAIPVGKLALYSAAAGIYPALTLPVSLDVGTDRRELLDDPLYLGYRAPRLRGAAYDEMLEAFVDSVHRVFPGAVLQWEDFKQHNALRILDRYRHRLPSFNDDIQGTAAVVLAGLLAARGGVEALRDDRILLLGAGAAGIGIARLLERTLGDVRADHGAPRIAMFDSRGLVHRDRDDLAEHQRPFAIDSGSIAGAGAGAGLEPAELDDPLAVARAFRATVLIGTTGKEGAFTEPLIREVARNATVPVILPLSNPNDRAEAKAADVEAWTDGRALIATGSPGPAPASGRVVGQANNVFIFPGVGLGSLVAEAREVTDDAFVTAAETLAAQVSPARLAAGGIYPAISDLRAISRAIAIAVVRRLRDSGYGRQLRDEEIEPAVDAAMWSPTYVPYEPVSMHVKR